jgi:cyanophycinase
MNSTVEVSARIFRPVRRLVLCGGGVIPQSVWHHIMQLSLRKAAFRDGTKSEIHIGICTAASRDSSTFKKISEDINRSFQKNPDYTSESEAFSGILADVSPLSANPMETGIFHRLRFTQIEFLQTEEKLEPQSLEVLELQFANKDQQIPEMRRNASNAHYSDILDSCDVLFFSGGDQNLILDVLKETPFEYKMKELWRKGQLLIAGTSAGLQVCCDVALTGSFRNNPESREHTQEDFPLREISLNTVNTRSGFGFLKNTVLDQHFSQRSRHNRLFSTALDNTHCVAIGVDESTALSFEIEERSSRATPKVLGKGVAFCLKHTLQENTMVCSIVWEGQPFPFEIDILE